eukprot:scaffold3988_cov243-Pinguiococcus_pyrenoidosus.AAC.4
MRAGTLKSPSPAIALPASSHGAKVPKHPLIKHSRSLQTDCCSDTPVPSCSRPASGRCSIVSIARRDHAFPSLARGLTCSGFARAQAMALDCRSASATLYCISRNSGYVQYKNVVATAEKTKRPPETHPKMPRLKLSPAMSSMNITRGTGL